MAETVKFYPAYWGGKKLACPSFPNDETVKVETDVFEEQMIVALDKVRACMEEAGSYMDNVIKTLMMLKDVKDYPKMRKTELEYYQKYAPRLVEDPPARTFMEVGLAKPEFLVGIDVVGVVSRG